MVGLEFQQLVNVLNKKAIPMYIQIQYVNKENDISVGLSFDNSPIFQWLFDGIKVFP